MQLTLNYSRIKLSRRVQANWGTDGDFITPAGEVIHVGENHTLFMRKHPEMFGDNNDPDDMIDHGWVKTRMIGWIFSIDANGGMNQKQLHVLQDMVQDRRQFSDPHIQVLMKDGDLYRFTCDEFQHIKYPNQIKRGLRSAVRN